MTTKQQALKNLKDAHANLRGVMGKHADHGARDTEPDMVYQGVIVAQLQRIANGDGKSPGIPSTISGWQLYHQDGAGKAAIELRSSTAKVCRAIRAAFRAGGWRDVCEWAEDVCWRCNVWWINK